MKLAKRAFKFFAAGVVIGVLSWTFGGSGLPAFFLGLVSGFGWLLLATTLLALWILVSAARDQERFNSAAGFISDHSISGLARCAAALLGICAVAAICWLATESAAALGTLLYGVLLTAVLFFCAWGLRALQPERSDTAG